MKCLIRIQIYTRQSQLVGLLVYIVTHKCGAHILNVQTRLRYDAPMLQLLVTLVQLGFSSREKSIQEHGGTDPRSVSSSKAVGVYIGDPKSQLQLSQPNETNLQSEKNELWDGVAVETTVTYFVNLR